MYSTKVAQEIASRKVRSMRALLLEQASRGTKFDRKPGRANLSTADDLFVERFLAEQLEGLGLGPVVLAEEAGGSGESATGWIIDPIDGTTNFVHGYPAFAISIAHMTERRVDLGVVYDPVLDEEYSARAGEGAYLNGAPIQRSDLHELSDALVATGIPYAESRIPGFIRLSERLARQTHGLRIKGPAALDLCYVACGRLDAYAEYDLQPWDFAAGALVATESGCWVSTFSGEELRPRQSSVLASNGWIHQDMLDLVRDDH